jgi:hypothetical protein
MYNPPVVSLDRDKDWPKYAPLLVNKFWRRAAVQCPRLWCSISISTDMLSERSAGGLLQSWFQRSGVCDLEVSIELSVLPFSYTPWKTGQLPSDSWWSANIAILVSSAPDGPPFTIGRGCSLISTSY